jgi:ubiquitin C-terminal hydrolase
MLVCVCVCVCVCDWHDTAPEAESGHCVYNLVGVSNHMGGLGGGHYTA